MESQGTFGGLIPLWILGAPFLLALFELFTTPKPAHKSGRDGIRAGPQAMNPMPATGSTAQSGRV